MNSLTRLIASAFIFFGAAAHAAPLKIERLVKLNNPWGLTVMPDGRLLITEKAGRLRIFSDGKLSAPVKGVPKVAFRGQGGLLDVEIDPNFSINQLVYISYAEAAEEQPTDPVLTPDPRLGEVDTGDTVLKGGAVARGRLEGNELKDVQVIWRQIPKTIGLGHFGGRMAFSPDGKLFITSGERQRFTPAQDFESNLGKIVRINSDGTIPSDNPFVGTANALPDIWALGNRNPLGIAFEPGSNRLWVHEMGPRHGDELNLIEPGLNFGWPIVSYGDHYNGEIIPRPPTRPEFKGPNYYWRPAISPSGFIFYTGALFTDWQGSGILGGLSSKALVRVRITADQVVEEERIDMKKRIREVAQAPDGAVLVLTDGPKAELLRLSPKQ